MKFQFAKYFIVIGFVFIIFTIGALTIFREGYMDELGTYSPSAEYAEDPVIYHGEIQNSILYLAEGTMGLEIINL